MRDAQLVSRKSITPTPLKTLSGYHIQTVTLWVHQMVRTDTTKLWAEEFCSDQTLPHQPAVQCYLFTTEENVYFHPLCFTWLNETILRYQVETNETTWTKSDPRSELSHDRIALPWLPAQILHYKQEFHQHLILQNFPPTPDTRTKQTQLQ